LGFDAIRDQDTAVRMLRTVLRKKRLAHAYLFEGPESVGKRLAAMTFAKAVNCAEPGDDPCDTCRSCTLIAGGKHPDVMTLEPTGSGRIIHTDAIEELLASACLKPYQARYRVFIIVDAERMHISAANKFLKTLEEPPGNSLFILVSHSPDGLLPTIASRCQRVRFQLLAPHTIEEILIRDRGLSTERARAVSLLAHGQVSTAFELADSEKREFVIALVTDLTQTDPFLVSQAFLGRIEAERDRLKRMLKTEESASESEEDSEELAERLEAQQASVLRKEVLSYLDLLRAWFRDMLVFGETGLSDRLFNADSAEMVRQLAQRYKGSDIQRKIDAIARAEMLLESNVKEGGVFKEMFFSLAP